MVGDCGGQERPLCLSDKKHWNGDLKELEEQVMEYPAEELVRQNVTLSVNVFKKYRLGVAKE